MEHAYDFLGAVVIRGCASARFAFDGRAVEVDGIVLVSRNLAVIIKFIVSQAMPVFRPYDNNPDVSDFILAVNRFDGLGNDIAAVIHAKQGICIKPRAAREYVVFAVACELSSETRHRVHIQHGLCPCWMNHELQRLGRTAHAVALDGAHVQRVDAHIVEFAQVNHLLASVGGLLPRLSHLGHWNRVLVERDDCRERRPEFLFAVFRLVKVTYIVRDDQAIARFDVRVECPNVNHRAFSRSQVGLKVFGETAVIVVDNHNSDVS